MSLQVWLPLDGNIENQGLNPITFTNASNAATVNTNGKIGQCYYFSTAAQRIWSPYTFGSNDTCSIACWFKVDSISSTTQWIFNCGNGGGGAQYTHIGAYVTTDAITYCCGGQSGVTISTPLSANIWYHIAVCLDTANNKKYLYLNGNLLDSRDYTGTGFVATMMILAARASNSSGSNGNYGIIGYMNDFRFYDHCLSATEVREISQGLVLHYKLDTYNLFNPNTLTQDIYLYSNGNTSTSGAVGNWCLTDYISVFPSTSYIGYNLVNGGNGNPSICFYDKNKTYTRGQAITANTPLNITTTDTEYYVRISIRITDNDITKMQFLEIPTIIQDSSGYGHNGSILNTVNISSDTPRYLCSTSLPNGNSMINCGRGGMVTDSITVNMWLKSSSWANPTSCTESGGWNFEASGDYFRFPIYISEVGYKYGRSTITKAQICNNQWHMLTGIYDRINQKVQIYVDGQLDNDYDAGTSNNIKYHGSNVIWIGAEATSSNTTASNGMVGLFSDFRIYATALSADDIKSLYNTSMKIDNLQNIHTYEFYETNPNILAAKLWANGYTSRNPVTSPFTNYTAEGEPQFTANSTSASTEYIEINPTGHTYEYDLTVSINAGNHFYLGFERYDANKTARSNQATIYVLDTKPSTDVVKKHYTGTVNLSTDGVNTCKYIVLRILNGWSGTTSGVTGQSIIHNLSLREIGTKQISKITKQGKVITEEVVETYRSGILKNGIIEGTELIEF